MDSALTLVGWAWLEPTSFLMAVKKLFPLSADIILHESSPRRSVTVCRGYHDLQLRRLLHAAGLS